MQKFICGGAHHSMARLIEGTLMAWGRNSHGQIGDGTTINRPLPTPIPQIVAPRDIAAGSFSSYALCSDGFVRTWGLCTRLDGLLFVDTPQTTPARIEKFRRAAAIDCHGETLALYKDSVYRWSNTGFLGPPPPPGMFGFVNPIMFPNPVPGIDRAVAVSAGLSSSYVLRAASPWLLAWGRNDFGQIGDGTYTHRATPVRVRGLPRITAISAGSSHCLALDHRGRVWGWGWNLHGQLGSGSTAQTCPTPILIERLPEGIKAIAAGAGHNLALDHDGQVWAWGMNSEGQVGDGSRTLRRKPTIVLDQVKAVAAGGLHSFAVDKLNRISAWGDNSFGQLGDGTSLRRLRPRELNTIGEVGFGPP